MTKSVAWRSAMESDAGQVRAENQDRGYADDELGVFLVVDGLGGHAAGEKAAETAVAVISEEMAKPEGDPVDRIRGAITAANNRIFEEAEADPNLRGMACVLTLALICDDKVFVGHVGDSRLYLTWNGSIRKITSDHSPVGEREDAGELSEAEAMAHPRRHEVFRDVGSRRRSPDEEDFIEIKEFLFKPDAAILVCSDGLSDLVTSAEMLQAIERYEGDPAQVTGELTDAANLAGGTDNITAIFVAGSEFLGNASPAAAEARARNAITKARDADAQLDPAPQRPGRIRRLFTARVAFLIYGFVLGVALALALRWPKP
ncbi:MAG TPA: protein phosphatase 2C domain-containing protein [Bryobacteraceae bacterium]|nr:protein phosphatase 2C domain-containing protein [Bryobacteraceae bacterium]